MFAFARPPFLFLVILLGWPTCLITSVFGAEPSEQEKAEAALAELDPALPTLFIASDSSAAKS